MTVAVGSCVALFSVASLLVACLGSSAAFAEQKSTSIHIYIHLYLLLCRNMLSTTLVYISIYIYIYTYICTFNEFSNKPI